MIVMMIILTRVTADFSPSRGQDQLNDRRFNNRYFRGAPFAVSNFPSNYVKNLRRVPAICSHFCTQSGPAVRLWRHALKEAQCVRNSQPSSHFGSEFFNEGKVIAVETIAKIKSVE